MLIRGNGFNLYLILALVLVTAAGCKSPESKKKSLEKKVLSTLRVHLEARPDPMGRTETADVYRASPIKFTIDKEPFLTEASVKEAKVTEVTGGFALQIQFDRQGGLLLEQYTSANRTKHLIISSQFVNPGEEKINQGRWLAAPQIKTHITDGLLIFTPDATKEEAQRIALGLNHVAEKLSTGQEVKW
jgi:preprotein translocase subunit SecD